MAAIWSACAREKAGAAMSVSLAIFSGDVEVCPVAENASVTGEGDLDGSGVDPVEGGSYRRKKCWTSGDVSRLTI